MTWIKLNDNAPRHPKISGLSAHAFRAWIHSLCYASEFLTDGILPVAFLVTVPRKLQDELIAAGLWLIGPPVTIHDYLEHQTSKESVEKERERNRNRRKGDRRETAGRTSGTPGGRTEEKPRPESRGQRTDTEHREQRQQNGAAAPLIMNSLAYERRKHQCAFVGARLEVPHALHADMRKLLGGTNTDVDLQAWYADLDEEIEESGESIAPDVFRWLKARFANWKAASGERTAEQIIASLNARKAARS